MANAPSLNPPKQARSQRTLERLVQASLELLAEQGPEGVTVHAVVGRAGSSVGSFYARFEGKEDLLHYLADRVWEEALERWREAVASQAWSEMGLAEIAEGAVGLLLEVERLRADRLQDLDRMVQGGDAHARFRAEVVRSLETLLLERASAIDHVHPEIAVRLGLSAVLGIVDSGFTLPDDGDAGPEETRELLLHECTELLLSYLTKGASGRGSEPVEFFDVWG